MLDGGAGRLKLIKELAQCKQEGELKIFLQKQADLHLQNFIGSGRKEGVAFDEIYRNLKKLKGNRGLSNSEVALAAALWSAQEKGCDIEHVSLSEYFTPNGGARDLADLKNKLINTDGIIVSTPVYFGDRGSLAQGLVEFILQDSELHAKMKNKIYAGIAVGAKRNGGQETTLIYQLLDFINTGFLGVGNDSETTSQYGGTGHAGDVGTMAMDDYGIDTCMGTGRRVASIATIAKIGSQSSVKGKVRVMFWILQDKNGYAMGKVNELIDQFDPQIDVTLLNISEEYIKRCIACDICPTHVGMDDEYRCIIKNGKSDGMINLHNDLLRHDIIIPVVYSSTSRNGIISNYQKFIERTRYLRRGDYVFSNVLAAPLVYEEIGANENMHIRMATSILRHHTILAAPMIAYIQNGIIINKNNIVPEFARLLGQARLLCAGKLSAFSNPQASVTIKYNPVGYILSSEKDKEDEQLESRVGMNFQREILMKEDMRIRLNSDKLLSSEKDKENEQSSIKG